MNVLELFAGIGGMSLGLQRAGMTIVGHVEIEPFKQAVLRKHWPQVPQHDDIRTAVDWWRSEPRPEVDVIAGGYPCQGESQAGRRLGVEDERWLWPEMARVIHALRPRWVIGENVAGHRTKGLRFVLRDLERLGYAARAGTIRACDLGAPHIRTRIITMAHADREGRDERPGTRGQRRGRTQPADCGADVADADRERQQQPAPQRRGQEVGGRAADRGEQVRHVADAEREGLEGWGALGGAHSATGRPEADGGRRQSAGPREAYGRRWWPTQPGLGGATDGLPSGMDGPQEPWERGVPRTAYNVPRGKDRIRALGDAIVPQVAEYIGRLVIEADQGSN